MNSFELTSWTLAQAAPEVVGVPAATAPAPAAVAPAATAAAPATTTATTGTATGEGTPLPMPAAQQGNPLTFLLIISLAFVAMIVISSLAGRKERKARAKMLAELGRRDRVQTVGGVIGEIVEVTDSEITLIVDEHTKTRIRFAKSAVQQVLRSESGGATSSIEPKNDARVKS